MKDSKVITGSFTKKKEEKFAIKKDGSLINQDGNVCLDKTMNIISNEKNITPPTSNFDNILSEKNNRLVTHHIETLIIGCRLAQEKGVYTLEEARTIMNAIDFLNSDK